MFLKTGSSTVEVVEQYLRGNIYSHINNEVLLPYEAYIQVPFFVRTMHFVRIINSTLQHTRGDFCE